MMTIIGHLGQGGIIQPEELINYLFGCYGTTYNAFEWRKPIKCMFNPLTFDLVIWKGSINLDSQGQLSIHLQHKPCP